MNARFHRKITAACICSVLVILFNACRFVSEPVMEAYHDFIFQTHGAAQESCDLLCEFGTRVRPLLSTRFQDLESFQKTVSIEYDRDYAVLDSMARKHSAVTLVYADHGDTIRRTMQSGISQKDLVKLKDRDAFQKFLFVLKNPEQVRHRRELGYIYLMARKNQEVFGSGDVAFYLFSEASLRHINTPEGAFRSYRDSLEKGYINTFNHITAQAIVSSFFSVDLADLISDLHERDNMRELTTGMFTEKQLADTLNHPVDNYVDIINNEIGQRLGLRLKEKFRIGSWTKCTPQLLSDYLNEIQHYYSWSFGIGMDRYAPTELLVIRMSEKINILLGKDGS